jgi:starch synthase
MGDIKVLSVASEIFPLVKTGGLGDVAGALPGALAAEGVVVRSLVPGYPAVMSALAKPELVHGFAQLFGGPANLLAGRAGGLDLFVLDAPHLFARYGNPYVAADGVDWSDNGLRFGALSRAAASMGEGLVPGFVPDVVHCHDWPTGLTAAYLVFDGGPRPGTVMTIHNLSFQGQFPLGMRALLGLPERALAVDGVEYYGAIGYLKAGLQFSDRITTVSPTYAAEIRTPEGGMGLDGLLRGRAGAVSGILNGIDDAVWDPARDAYLPARYDARRLIARAKNKAAVQARFGLEADASRLQFGIVSRLFWQKGVDLVLETLPTLLAEGAQLAVLGTGDQPLEAAFTAAAAAHPGRVGFVRGYDEELAHVVQGGADAILVPSRFEPCGLTQLCALRYGAVPVVARVGGLADTIIDANEAALGAGVASGVQFAPVSAEMLDVAIRRAAALYRDSATWKRMQLNGMRADVSWRLPARRYATLYRELVAARAAA